MYEIQKKIIKDENARPVAVQIDYADWLEIERLLSANSGTKNPQDLRPLAGTLHWSEDAVTYQRRVREEWRR